MKNMKMMETLGFVLMWIAVPFAFINETVAIIILLAGIALFIAGIIVPFILFVRAMPHIPTISNNKEGE